MKRTSFRPGWRRQHAGQKGLFQNVHISVFLLLEDPLSVLQSFFFFFFFRRKKGFAGRREVGKHVWSFCTNNAQAPSLFSNVTLTSRHTINFVRLLVSVTLEKREGACALFVQKLQTRKKGAYVFDSLVEREKGRERESLSYFFLFFFLTIPVCHHSGRQRQKEAADRSVTSRNKSGIAQQRNDFGQDNFDAPSQLGFQRHALAKFTATKS